MRPYAHNTGQAPTFHDDADYIIHAGELAPGRGAAVFQYETAKGLEPQDHTHPTEDEMFYVLSGEIEFRCDGDVFQLEAGGFVFLPRGLQHGYTVLSEAPVRLLAITAPAEPSRPDGWGGYVAEMERAM